MSAPLDYLLELSIDVKRKENMSRRIFTSSTSLKRTTMKTLLVAAVVAIAASVAGFAQSSASAAPPVAVSIQIHPDVSSGFELGTWDASGAIDDSGGYVRVDGNGTGSIPDCFCWPEHIGAFQETFVLTGSRGTLTVKAEHRLIPTGEMFGDTIGVWQVVAGTGAYAGSSGHGTDLFDRSTLTLYLTGVISKAG